MGFVNGMITLLFVIIMLAVFFIVGFVTGFAGLYLAIRKFCPEAYLILDAKAHQRNKECVEKNMEEYSEEADTMEEMNNGTCGEI